MTDSERTDATAGAANHTSVANGGDYVARLYGDALERTKAARAKLVEARMLLRDAFHSCPSGTTERLIEDALRETQNACDDCDRVTKRIEGGLRP